MTQGSTDSVLLVQSRITDMKGRGRMGLGNSYIQRERHKTGGRREQLEQVFSMLDSAEFIHPDDLSVLNDTPL